jgi:hypothetical protein
MPVLLLSVEIAVKIVMQRPPLILVLLIEIFEKQKGGLKQGQGIMSFAFRCTSRTEIGPRTFHLAESELLLFISEWLSFTIVARHFIVLEFMIQ